MVSTASPKYTSNRVVFRWAASCRWKKSEAMDNPCLWLLPVERHAGSLTLSRRGFQPGRFGEAERVGHHDGREDLPLVVVGRHRIVEGLAGKAHLVLRRGELFLQGHHVLVGLEGGIGFRQGEEPAQRTAELGLCLAQFLH